MPAHTRFGPAPQQQCTLDVLVAASNKLHVCNMSVANTLAARVLPSRCRPTTEISCTTSHTTAHPLPPPLTEAALSEAYTQLTPGAEKSIKTVVQWWRTNKLSSHEVLATVQSFSGSSTALQRIFATATSESEKEDSQLQSERIRKEFEKRSDMSSISLSSPTQPVEVCRKGFFKGLARSIQERHRFAEIAGSGDDASLNVDPPKTPRRPPRALSSPQIMSKRTLERTSNPPSQPSIEDAPDSAGNSCYAYRLQGLSGEALKERIARKLVIESAGIFSNACTTSPVHAPRVACDRNSHLSAWRLKSAVNAPAPILSTPKFLSRDISRLNMTAVVVTLRSGAAIPMLSHGDLAHVFGRHDEGPCTHDISASAAPPLIGSH